MYESPITIISEDIIDEIVEKQNAYLIKIIHKMGFDVDEEEIKKALTYDRNQWERGYADGKMDGYKMRDTELVRCIECQYLTQTRITTKFYRVCRRYGAGKSDDGFCDEGKRKDTDE